MNTEKQIAVWDIFVRVFHWVVVAAFATAYATSESGPHIVHEIAGYTILALVTLRVLWGFVGTQHARFADFVRSPSTVIAYAKSLRAGKPARYLGHNPLGGYMVVALLVMLSGITLAGHHLDGLRDRDREAFLATAGLTVEQAEAQHLRIPKSAEQRQWREIHETLVDATLVLIALHVLGVFMAGRHHQENLVKAMIDGRKRSETPPH